MAAPKIILLGSLNGDFEPAFKKLAALHSKNSFALAILTGDVFSPSTNDATITALLDGRLNPPLPTYFTIGSHALPSQIAAKVEAGQDICENLHYLGKRSITKTSDGIRIVALGGQLDPNLVGGQSTEQLLPFHTTDDAKSLKGANTTDILLTYAWPANIWVNSKVVLEPHQKASIPNTQVIGELCAALKPRYHISASPDPFFYEREPFVHPTESERDAAPESICVTRFISMAPYGNQAKAKAMYAFSLNKSDDAIPSGATPTPWSTKKKRPAGGEVGYSRFDISHHHGSRHNKRRRASPPPGPDRCYFCLSSPQLATHMCCSIGDDAYVAIAKGPLPTSSTFSSQGLDFPCHLIIIPLPHAPTIASISSSSSSSSNSLDPDSEAFKTQREMTRLRESIQTMVSSKSSHRLGVICWEISRERNVHLIWQLLPIPATLIQNGLAEAALKVEAENQGLPGFNTEEEEPSLEKQANYGDFFRVWLWADGGDEDDGGGVKKKTLVMPLSPEQRFDLQFGRRVVAKLMGLEDRIIWQDCGQTEEEETRDVEAFREAFKPWDFTLEG